jgi:HK97 family phage major capsid protein
MTPNLKMYLDAVTTAEAHVQEVAAQIDALFTQGKQADALAMRPDLESAKAAAKSANELYLSMRGAGGEGGERDAGSNLTRRLMQVDDRSLAIGMSQSEIEKYSLVRLIGSAAEALRGNARALDSAGLEMEASRAMAQKLGRNPQGFFVPWDVMITPPAARGGAVRIRNTQSVGDPTTGGYLVETMQGSFIDVLRNKMVTRQAGAQVLTGLVGDVDFPKKTASSTAYWLGEGTSPTKSQLTFGQVEARNRTVGAYAQLTRKLLKQSSMDVEMMVRDDMATTLAIAIDAAGLHGLGYANQPRGVANTPGIGSVVGNTNGEAPDWTDIVDLETAVAIDNADIGALAYITNTKVRGKLKKTLITTTYGDKMVWGDGPQPLNGYPAYVTNQVRSDLTKGNQSLSSAIFFGNWNDLIYALWGGLDILVDPYTNSTSGDVLVTAMQDADVVVRRAESFSAMLDALTA